MAQPSEAETFRVAYSVPRHREGWELSEETMPESTVHDDAVALLRAILAFWVASSHRVARVSRNLAVRWDEQHPKVGVDPDVCLLEPPPPEADLSSVRTWLRGHGPPVLTVEVVSETNPRKDYVVAPDKYAASGTGELWIFDPLLSGPKAHGGPFRLQLWQRSASGELGRSYAGDGPIRSPLLGAWLVVGEASRLLRLADDPGGARLWPTAEEAERAAKEVALARIAELEAQLARNER